MSVTLIQRGNGQEEARHEQEHGELVEIALLSRGLSRGASGDGERGPDSDGIDKIHDIW